MKKITYLLLIFLILLTPSLKVNAAIGIPNLNGTEFVTSYSADFADNTNNQITRLGATYSNSGHFYSSNTEITTTGVAEYGANILFDALTPFVQGYTYSVSILIGIDALVTSNYPIASTPTVCVAETLNNAVTRYNNTAYPCDRNARVYNTVGTGATWNVADDDSSSSRILQYSILTYIFKAYATGTSITMPYNTNVPLTSAHFFGGYHVELLSDNTALSSEEISTIIDDSNLASASSVEEVQTEIENVKTEFDELNTAVNSESENFEDTSCGIICKLGKLPGKIVDGFIEGLKSLFIPEEGYFENWFNDLKLFFEEKLGFLSTPFTLIIDFLNMYLNLDADTEIIINIPDITVPNFENHKIISATTLNWSNLLKSKESLNNLWQLYLSFIDVFLILNFIGLCESKYNRIFGGDTSNYEYYTVEDSTLYNPEGEVTGSRKTNRYVTRKKVE